MDYNMLKRWKKLNATPKINNRGIKFLKRTLSLSHSSVPNGFLALCVGGQMKRYVIPMDYLSHKAFKILLRETEEEFGFYHEGILRIPCDVFVFESILEIVEKERKGLCCCTMEANMARILHPNETIYR